MPTEIIGRGTWIDKLAREVLEREEALGRALDVIRTESGLGASGFPHIGSIGDGVRAYAIKLAIEDQGRSAEYIAFSDDMDGLRKIPAGLPDELNKYLGYPVTSIPDPYRCHGSYGEHMTSLLLDALDRLHVSYTFRSARKVYREGLLRNEIEKLLTASKRVGEIIREELGAEGYAEKLPYFPVCEKCDRIYTTKAYDFMPKESKVLYRCEGAEIQERRLEGCNYEGEANYLRGEGKLSWVGGEFAARWSAFKVSFEAYGKDIADSVRVNDRICREVLGFEPPLHARYEMFLDKSGKKISKSAGNVFTPQVWLRYGSPQSLLLLLLKRFVGTRSMAVTDIPQYVAEFDELEDIYFGKKKVDDGKEEAKLKGLYEYCMCLKPPEAPSAHVPYNLLVFLAKVAPKDGRDDFILAKIKQYGFDVRLGDVKERIGYATAWAEDFEEAAATREAALTATALIVTDADRKAISDVIQVIRSVKTDDELQNGIYDVAKHHGIPAKEFFKLLYQILIGSTSGPRLGPYINALGRQNTIDALARALNPPGSSTAP